MTYEERKAWAFGGVAVTVPLVYSFILLARYAGTPVEEIDYVWLLLGAIGAGMVLNAITAPKPDKTDERDKSIWQRGVFAAFFAMSALTLIPFGLALAGADSFWIANSIYLAYVLSAVTMSVVRIAAYRKGL